MKLKHFLPLPVALLLVILYPRLWTLIVAVVAMLFFTVLNRYGFTINVFLRWLRSSIAGRRKIGGIVKWM